VTASYPASVKSFTTKVDFTDTVLAEHVNTLQEEVNSLQANLGTYIKTGSGWVGDVDFVTTNWNTLKDRLANIEYGLKDVYDEYVSDLGGSTIVSAAIGIKSLVIKARASQTANLIEFQTSASTVVTKVQPDGTIYTSNKQLVPIVYDSSRPTSVPAGTIWIDSTSNIAQLTTQSGIPSGGNINQLLAKNSNSNYDVSWVDPYTPSIDPILILMGGIV
jgi:hypothetical protein